MIGMDSHQSLQEVGRRLRMKVSSGGPGLGLGVDAVDEVIGDGRVLIVGRRAPVEQVERESSLSQARDATNGCKNY